MSTDRSSDRVDASVPPPGDGGRADMPDERAAVDAHRMRYQESFEFASDGQLLTDHQGIILEANYAAAALFQCLKEFLIGKPLGLFVKEGLRGRFYESLVKLGETGGSDEFETRVGRGDFRRDVAARVVSTGRSGGAPGTLRWLFHDLTERNTAQVMRVELLRRAVSAEEDERRRIAREIHDQLGQDLTGVALGLKSLEASLPHGSPAGKRLRELQEVIDRIGRNAHDMALELRPTALDDLGLGAALEMLVRRWTERVGVPVDFHCAASGTARYAPDIETTIYRVVQEALTNVVKHSDATRVSVVVEYTDGQLIAIVEDDGRGFEVEARNATGRLGLLGMYERIALVGGTLQLESSPGQGTTVRASVVCRAIWGLAGR